MTLHIFNPSHDEALAAHTAHYCPSRPARQLAHALAELPLQWAAEGDVCLRLPASGGTEGVEVPDWTAVERIEPWGWDRHIVGLLRRLGAPERLLPSDERLCALRRMSSRETGVRWAEGLHVDDLPGVVKPRAVFCTSTAAAVEAALAMDGRAMVKLPWSCSGRGVWPFADDAACRRRIDKAVRLQDGVEVQARCEGLLDAAMEFTVDADGRVHFEGLSLFTTAPGGAYGGNLTAHPDRLRRTWLDCAAKAGCPLSETVLETLIERTAARLEACYGAGQRCATWGLWAWMCWGQGKVGCPMWKSTCGAPWGTWRWRSVRVSRPTDLRVCSAWPTTGCTSTNGAKHKLADGSPALRPQTSATRAVAPQDSTQQNTTPRQHCGAAGESG